MESVYDYYTSECSDSHISVYGLISSLSQLIFVADCHNRDI